MIRDSGDLRKVQWHLVKYCKYPLTLADGLDHARIDFMNEWEKEGNFDPNWSGAPKSSDHDTQRLFDSDNERLMRRK